MEKEIKEGIEAMIEVLNQISRCKVSDAVRILVEEGIEIGQSLIQSEDTRLGTEARNNRILRVTRVDAIERLSAQFIKDTTDAMKVNDFAWVKEIVLNGFDAFDGTSSEQLAREYADKYRHEFQDDYDDVEITE